METESAIDTEARTMNLAISDQLLGDSATNLLEADRDYLKQIDRGFAASWPNIVPAIRYAAADVDAGDSALIVDNVLTTREGPKRKCEP